MATLRLCLHYCEIFDMLQSNILYILHDSVLNSYKFLEKRSLVSPETCTTQAKKQIKKTNRQTSRKASRQTNKQTGEQPN